MNNEEPFRDQAERLKQRIEKINEKIEDNDILPPREQIHRQKKKKTKLKLKYPLIRLLVLFFILLPIIIFSVISYQDGAQKVTGIEKSTEESVGYETINLENSKEDDEISPEESDEVEVIIEDVDSKEADSEKKEEQQLEVNVNTSVQPPVTNETKADTGDNKTEQEKVTDKTETTPATQTETSATADSSTETNTTAIIYHTVKSNENLYRLAMKYYQSPKGMDIIMQANKLKSKQIRTGQVLKIPPNN
jgi:LysM repeat protein